MTVKEKQKKEAAELRAKYYGKKKNRDRDKIAEMDATLSSVPSTVLGNTGRVAGSRADLMDQVRARGVKNFRILNKDELEFVLCDNQSPENISACVAAAVARWKSGWGTRKKDKVAS